MPRTPRTASAILALGLALLGAARTAAQAPPVAPAFDSSTRARIARMPSPRTATWLSIGLTVVPVAAGAALSANSGGGSGSILATAGLLIGPAAGYWYGHAGSSAWPGILIRTGGLAIAALGAAGCIGDVVNSSACSSAQSVEIVGGTLLVVGSAIWDMATVGGKVTARNRAVARAMVLPLFSPSRRSVGVEVVVGL